jgi:ribosomal protein L11 methyltransferase
VIRLAVRVERRDAELVLAELLDLAPSGLEEVQLDDGRTEYALYGAPGELPALPDLHAAAGDAVVEVLTTEIADNWDRRWRAFHQPVDIAGRLRIAPPWADSASGGQIDVVIDPAQAFGTGAHPTTRLCLELLLETPPTGSLLDVGCGSGVLAITAAKLGFAPVMAVDNDPRSLDATRANAAVNGVTVSTCRIDLRHDRLPTADTVLANLLAPLVGALATGLSVPPHRLIAGGLLIDQLDDAVAALSASLGLAERRRRAMGDWAAVLLGD